MGRINIGTARKQAGIVAVHTAIIGGAALAFGLTGAGVAFGGLLLSDGIRKAVFAKPAHAVPGNRKVFYAWSVDLTNPGALPDFTEVSGGYKLDAAVAPGAYPDSDKGAYITGLGEAFAQCAAEVRRIQSRFKQDARGRLFRKIFGVDATNPVRPLGANEDDEEEIGRVDVPERVTLARISAANREKLGGELDLDTNDPQDVDNGAGGV